MLLELFELASNNALQHDAQSQQRLTKLQGKTLLLHVRPVDQSIAMTPHPHGLEFSTQEPEDFDVKLSLSVAALIKLSRDGMEDADLQPGEMEIAGDPIIGQRFAQLISGLDIDWEAFLAEHVGDTPAVFITATASKAREIADDSKGHMKRLLKRLLDQDMQLLITDQGEVDDFLDGVDALRADADKLSLRLQQLQAQH